MIALIDYGIGNLRSVQKALQAVGADVQLTEDPAVILAADKVVLPGVGAFGDGMRGLQSRGLDDVVLHLARRGVPLLGICVGMQLLFEVGEELGEFPGLGLLPGRVKRLPETGLKIPQTGWNQIEPAAGGHPLLAGLPAGSYAYFNHSFYCDAAPSDTIGWTEYGLRYASVVVRDNIHGAQFHPEKSQSVGLRILRNFFEM